MRYRRGIGESFLTDPQNPDYIDPDPSYTSPTPQEQTEQLNQMMNQARANAWSASGGGTLLVIGAGLVALWLIFKK